MKEKSKKELQQENANVEPQKELSDEELNKVAGGFGSQIASTFSKFSLFRRNNIDTQITTINCW